MWLPSASLLVLPRPTPILIPILCVAVDHPTYRMHIVPGISLESHWNLTE
jgi:hypothetical protein